MKQNVCFFLKNRIYILGYVAEMRFGGVLRFHILIFKLESFNESLFNKSIRLINFS